VTVIAFVGLAALAAATCLAVTTASKSGKEAQNTLTPVILLVAALAGTALVPGLRSDGPLALVPFTGQVCVARDILTAPPDSGGAAIIQAKRLRKTVEGAAPNAAPVRLNPMRWTDDGKPVSYEAEAGDDGDMKRVIRVSHR
jgi:hypothetical protein